MEGLMGWAVLLLTIFFVGIAVVMTGLILLQEGKGGGLAALGGTKAAGIEGVTNPIRRATGYLAAMFFIVAITLSILRKPAASVGPGDDIPSTSAAAAVPDATTERPAESATPPATEATKTSSSATVPAPVSVTPSSVAVPPTTPSTTTTTTAPPAPATPTPATPAEKK